MSSLSPKSNGLNKPQSASRDSIGDFIIGDKLGEGTFSKVCQGTHKITNEKVAIKIMSKAQIKEPSDKLRIEKEINIQKRLHHNCIIQQYCIIETKSTIYIITEYCSGGELFEYIVNKRKLYEVEACRIFQQLISGLEYLHKGGRCSSVAKFGANVLGIKPSIAVDTQTGRLDMAKKYRGKTELVYKQYITDRINEIKRIQPDRVVIANSGGVPADTIAFAKGMLEGRDKFEQVILADAGCTISSHCGPKTLAIFYIKK